MRPRKQTAGGLLPFFVALVSLVRAYFYPIVTTSLFAVAFVSSLFFNGMYIEYFALALGLLLFVMLFMLWRGYDHGLTISRNWLTLALSLFWAWLALTLTWSDVPYVSMINFWWVGSAVLVFWLMSLVPERGPPLSWIGVVILVLGAGLALYSLYQQLFLNVQAQSTFLTRNSHAGLMCLIAIPASSHFLLAPSTAPAARRAWLFGVVLFILYLSLAFTSSRGGLIGTAVGLAVLIGFAYRRIPRQRLMIFLGIVLTAYVMEELLHGEASHRLGSLVQLTQADPPRLYIWKQAWRMLMDNPWWGVGLGNWWLYWPPYRHPKDISAGFYVHNDYLQIWIEVGLPGLLLLLGIYAAVMWLFVRIVRAPRTSTEVRIESAGLFGGLLAVAVHTFFDFDLYIHPIQLVMGLVLAQLHSLYRQHVSAAAIVLQPARRFGRRGYYTITALVLALPLFYFAALATSALLTYKARAVMAQGRLVDANNLLTRAEQLMPTSDMVLVTHSDMLRLALPKLPPEAAERTLLYREALALLDDAERVNPVRPQTFFVRALLYQQNPELAGPDWLRRATEAYDDALRRDPLAFWARESYARLLLAAGQSQKAREVLEGGIAYTYVGGPGLVSYYKLAAEVRGRQGDTAGALELVRKIAEIFGQPFNPPTQVPIGTMALQHSG